MEAPKFSIEDQNFSGLTVEVQVNCPDKTLKYVLMKMVDIYFIQSFARIINESGISGEQLSKDLDNSTITIKLQKL